MKGRMPMRAVLQLVTESRARIADEQVARIAAGLLVLLGVAEGDADAQADSLANQNDGPVTIVFESGS